MEKSDQRVLKRLKRVIATMPKEFQEDFRQRWKNEKKRGKAREER